MILDKTSHPILVTICRLVVLVTLTICYLENLFKVLKINICGSIYFMNL